MKKVKIVSIVWVCVCLFFVFFNLFVVKKYQKNISSLENAPQKHTGLVLWAGAKNGILSHIFQDRLDTAIWAYKNWKIKKILISWDNGKTTYDELTPAKIYTNKIWVPKEDIFLDYAGFDTYDSIYRAKAIFQAHEFLVFSQDFHLPRALYICDELEITCTGVLSNKRKYLWETRYNLRENLARIKAFWNTFLWNATPKFLWEHIPITGIWNFENSK